MPKRPRRSAKRTLGRDAKDLDAQQQADLKKLASQQVDLSRRLEKSAAADGPDAAARSKLPIRCRRPRSPTACTRRSSKPSAGRCGRPATGSKRTSSAQAAQQQAKIGKDLDDLLAILSNRREQELTRLVKQLREAEQRNGAAFELATGRIAQANAGTAGQARRRGTQTAIGAAGARAEDNCKKRQPAWPGGSNACRPSRPDAAPPARPARWARPAARASRATRRTAGEQADQAEKDLEDAQQQLAERRTQAEEDLAREQMAKLEDALKSLQNAASKLIAETERLEKLRAADGQFTRAQASTVNDLARQQKSLQAETSLLAEKLSLTEVINLALDGAAQADDPGERTARAAARPAARRRRPRRRPGCGIAQLLAAFENRQQAEEGRPGGGRRIGRRRQIAIAVRRQPGAHAVEAAQDLAGRSQRSLSDRAHRGRRWRRGRSKSWPTSPPIRGKLAELAVQAGPAARRQSRGRSAKTCPTCGATDCRPTRYPRPMQFRRPMSCSTRSRRSARHESQVLFSSQCCVTCRWSWRAVIVLATVRLSRASALARRMRPSRSRSLDDALLNDLDNELLEGAGEAKKPTDPSKVSPKGGSDEKKRDPQGDKRADDATDTDGEDVGMPAEDADPLDAHQPGDAVGRRS